MSCLSSVKTYLDILFWLHSPNSTAPSSYIQQLLQHFNHKF